MEARTAELARKTNETDIKVAINLDDKMNQKININTGIGFLDHVSCESREKEKKKNRKKTPSKDA
jgi:imidazoleglycerol phosphate dehydratase HisB